MTWSVEAKKQVERQILDLPDEKVRFQVASKIAGLSDTPFPQGSKQLNRPGNFFRLRVGDYRVVYSVDKPSRSIQVLGVRHRKDVYRGW